jgi:acetylornithine deacetylase/succinyl-diaminopimelate desuccinylase-like protein
MVERINLLQDELLLETGLDREILERIDKEVLQERLDELCSLSSTFEKQDGKIVEMFPGEAIGQGGGRPAFSKAELETRKRLTDWVTKWLLVERSNKSIEQKEASFVIQYENGITVEHSPAGLLITYQGAEPDKPKIAFGSHIDTIMYQAGREDGQDGIVSAFSVLDALVKSGKKPQKSLQIALPTGEESRLVSFSGSMMLARGVGDKELDSNIETGFTLREGILRWANWAETTYGVAFNSDTLFERLRKPLIEKGDWEFHTELHACPNDTLEKLNSPIGTAERVMGADARIITLLIPSEPILPGDLRLPFRIEVKGFSGHVGSIPQLDGKRYCGAWFVLDQIILALRNASIHRIETGLQYFIKSIEIADQQMNRIPGKITLEGELHRYFPCTLPYNLYPPEVQKLLINLNSDIMRFAFDRVLKDLIKQIRFRYQESFGTDSQDIAIQTTQTGEIERPKKENHLDLFPVQDLEPVFKMSQYLQNLSHINIAQYFPHNNNYTCTIGTLKTKCRGVYELGVDTRAFQKEHLETGILMLKVILENLRQKKDIAAFALSESLPGSEPPAEMSKQVNREIERAAKLVVAGLETPSFDLAAGEDALVLQELAKVAMLLVRSYGTCHTTSEYTDPDDLALGAKTWLTALWSLASRA